MSPAGGTFAGSPLAPAPQPGVAIVLTNYLNGNPADNDTVAGLIAKGALNGVHSQAMTSTPPLPSCATPAPRSSREPTEQPWGARDCAIRDPSGNLIRIGQPPAGAGFIPTSANAARHTRASSERREELEDQREVPRYR